ncbi:MAG: Ig-like domain-containing protein [Verrucomicrobiota bacterium]
MNNKHGIQNAPSNWTAVLLFLAVMFGIENAQALSPALYPATYANGTRVDTAAIGTRTPLILTHGMQSSPDIWDTFLHYWAVSPGLQSKFKPYLFGYSTDEFSLRPGDPTTILGVSQRLGYYLQERYDSPPDSISSGFNDKPVVILAHSMGGLVARSMMQNYSFKDGKRGGDKVLRLITLATPHHGSPLANNLIVYAGAPYLPFDFVIDNFIIDLHLDFAIGLSWNCYDGREFWFCGPTTSDAYNGKLIVYGAKASVSTDYKWGLRFLNTAGYESDGLVPLQSALFAGKTINARRQVNGSCDHSAIYANLNTVTIGVVTMPVFDSVSNDLVSAIPLVQAPSITSVSPNTLSGLPSPQTQRITIAGSGFTSSSSLILNNGVQSYNSDPARLTYISSTEIKYDIAVGTPAATWTVKVVNSAVESDAYTFHVTAAADNTAPSAPIGLTASPSPWARNNLFYLDWTNPNDPSGIAKVWWKLGSAPASATDGLSFRLPAFKPLPMSLSQPEGTQMIYVWLEDGAGNKNRLNNAAITLRLDTTRPTIAITSHSTAVPYPSTQNTITLSGTFADTLSGVVSVTWLNNVGGSGTATTSGSANNGTWFTPSITLYSGVNNIVVTATDAAGNVGSATITVNYLDTSNSGTVNVTINPQAASTAGALWHFVGETFWRLPGVASGIAAGSRTVEFKGVDNWIAPQPITQNVLANQTTYFTGQYVASTVAQAPDAPSNPSPALGAVNVGRAQPRFSWSGGAPGGDLQYAFCIDLSNPTNPDPAQYTGWGSLTGNSFQFPGTTFTLPATTTFNWRVKARANGITVDGSVWRFTTEYAVADLAVKNLALDGNVEPGANVTLSATVTNQGDFVAPTGYLFYYLSRTPGGKEIRLNLPVSLVIWPLQPGQSTNVTFVAKLDGLPAGQSFIDAWVDTTAYGATGESNFENNLQSIQINYIDGKNPQVTYAALSTTFVKTGVANSIVYVATDDVGVKTMDFYYSTDDGVTWVPIQEGYVTTTPPFAGEIFNWAVPANLTVGANLKVRVVARDASGNWGESIAGPYLIHSGTAPVVKVIFPDGGEALPAGSTQPFRWSISAPNGVSYASLSVYYNNNNVTAQDITTNTTGTYSWTLPANLTTTVAKIRVTLRDQNGNDSEDWSDAPFSIADNSQPPPAPWNAAAAVTSAATGDPAGLPRIVADSTETLHLIYGLSHDAAAHTISFRYRKRIGTAWTNPSVVSFDAANLDNQIGSSYGIGNRRFAVDSNGHPHLVWATSHSFLSEESKNDVFYTYFDGASWASPQNVSIGVRSPLMADSIAWTRKADIPIASSTSAAAAVGGKLYFIYYDQIHQYDPVANTWMRKADAPPAAVGDGGATVVNGLIYAAGSPYDGNIRIYNPSTDSWATGAAMPSPQQGVRLAAAANGMVYAIGGDIGAFSGGTKTRMYNPGANSWTTMADMPTARSHPAVAAVGANIYVIGGYQSQQSMDVYDTVGNTWTTKAYPFAANIPPSFGGFAAVMNSKIYFVPGMPSGGGLVGSEPSVSRDVWEFDPATGGWTRMLPTQFAHGFGCGAAIGSKLYVLGGLDGSNAVSSMEEATLQTDFAGTVSSSPQVAVDAANAVHVLWNDGRYLQPDGSSFSSFSSAGEGNVYEAVRSGAGWSSPLQVTTGGLNLHAVVADQSGNLHLIHQSYNYGIAYSQRIGGSWSAPILTGAARYVYGLDMAVDSTSKVHLLYSGNDPQSSLINLNYITLSGTSWSSPERVSSIQYGVSPRLCLDSLDRPHAIWVGSQVDPQVLYSTKNGGGWVAPIQLNRASEPPAYGSVDAALWLGNNELDVVWLNSNSGNPNVLLNYANVGSAIDIYPPTIAINSPVSGDILSIGNQATVTWAATDNVGVTAVDLHYTTNGSSSWTLIATNQANNGTFAWAVPNLGTNAGQVRVTARDAAGNSGVGFSGTFTTTDLTPPTITITAPTNGATLIGGVTNNVVWTATDNAAVARIDLEFSLNNGASWSDMATNLTNGGSYPWLVPNSATTVLLIRATARDTAGLSASATTQPMTIVRANTPPMAPSSPFPLNGSTFVLTVSPQFSWSSSDLDGDPLTYQIHFGTNATPPIVSSGSAPSFAPGFLRPQKTYYWQVLVSDGKATTAGPLWSFTTEAGVLPATVLADHKRFTNGLFQFRLSGLFGESYSVQASTNLTSWQTLTNIINTNANSLFLDTAATSFPRRFYRAVMP